jgi:hypothetical protein
VALWFNPLARRVTASVISAFREALPGARVILSATVEDARREAEKLVARPPALLFCGGGDGTIVVLLNALRDAGARRLPTVGLLRLGTGNGWPRATNAPEWKQSVRRIGRVPVTAPTQPFQLVEIQGRLCHFAGAGWDATVLHDYAQNLAQQSARGRGGWWERLHKGVWGYLYATALVTVPEELRRYRDGRVKLTFENLGEPAWGIGKGGRPEPSVDEPGGKLFQGALSVAAVGSEPYWGAGFRAFPYALSMPGKINVRIYDRHVLEGVGRAAQLWRGGMDVPGMRDWFVTRGRFTFSQAVPWQVGGDVMPPEASLDFGVADQILQLLRWDLVD